MNYWLDRRHRDTKNSGFTLIELMVVMVIMAMLAGAATMSIRSSTKDRLLDEAKRFHGLVDLVKDEALFQSRAMGIGFSRTGYTFFSELDEPGLWELYDDDQFKAHQYFKGAQPDILIDDVPLVLPESSAKPDILIMPEGEITPFEFHITYPSEEAVKLKFNALGRLEPKEKDS